MGFRTILRTIFLAIALCVLLNNRQRFVKASSTNGGDNNHIARNRIVRFPSRTPAQYVRSRAESNPDFMDDDDLFDLTKRQSDDYGHMRFGKREFEDYGHMRFGRTGSE